MTKDTEGKNPVGRPRIEIDVEQLEKLCKWWCTAEEIASFFDMCVDTLDTRIKELGYENFSDYYKKYSDIGKCSLRQWQMKSAEGGSVPMQIWLGKQMLGQTDKVEADYNFSELPKIQVQFVDSNNEIDLDD